MYKTTAILLLLMGGMSTSAAFAQAAAGDSPVAAGAADAADAADAAARAETLEARYAEVEAEMRALQERLAVLARDYAALGGAVAPVLAPRFRSVREAEFELSRLELELEALKRQYTSNHPRVQLLLRQIEAAENRLAAMNRGVNAEAERRLEAEAAARGNAEAERRLEAEAAARRAAERRAEEARALAEVTRLEQQRGLVGNTPRYPSSAIWDAMQLVTLTPRLGEYFGTQSGILVLRAPADESLGLRDGDVILDIGGRVPTTPEHTLRILSSFVPGETLTLQIMRNGERETREVALPAADAQPAENGGAFPENGGGFPGGGGITRPAPSPASPPVRPAPDVPSPPPQPPSRAIP